VSQTIYPAIRYADADAAVTFLVAAFGATERVLYRDDNGTIRHGELIIAGAMVMIGEYDDSGWMGGEPPRPQASTVSLYVVVPNPDAHHAAAVAVGADVVRALTDTDYGSREYSVRDPEGNLWSFGTYDPSA
jgi:uncharacterized glyoxalase superfamily protein PhnB